MANLNFINMSVSEILQQFQTAYYNEHGETLRIGSDEFAAASIFTYALTVLFNTLNDSAKQRFIDTATGVFLDAIAATYGITQRPDGYYATTLARIYMSDAFIDRVYPQGTIRIQDQSGKVFVNARDFTYATRFQVPFRAEEKGSDYNGLPANSINQFAAPYTDLESVTNTEPSSGGVDASYYENDDNFRAWLKNEIESFAGAGTAQAYRGRAMNADSRMVDAYVVQQGDDIFETGKVKIYILAEDVGAVYYLVEAACKDPAFRPVCDYVEVYDATPINFPMPQTLVVTYENRFSPMVVERNSRILEEYRQYLRQKIGRPWVYAEIVERFKAVDDDGIYASDAVFVGVSSQNAPIYPDTGHIHNLTDMSVTVRYVDPH